MWIQKALTTIIILFLFILVSCSNSSNSQSPMEPVPSFNTDENISNIRTSLIVYNAVINPADSIFTITPLDRNSNYHFALTQPYPNTLQITGYGFTPNFWADIKLDHPVKGSGIDFFDPRVIAVIPVHAGSYFHYPVSGIYGNPGVLLEPDGYTSQFDELAPNIFGNVNPFMAYFKNQPNRKWSSMSDSEETVRWQMNLNGFGGDMRFLLVVDISTNYPSPSNPVIDNSAEPAALYPEAGSGLTPTGGSALINATCLDWQGESGIDSVTIESPALFDGTIDLAYSEPGPNPNEYIYTGIITNDKNAPVGNYNYLISATDKVTGIKMYQESSVTISNSTGNLIWAKRAGGLDMESGDAIAILSDNSFVVSGSFGGSAIFGPGEPNQTVLHSSGSSDVFVARYNTDGTLVWAKKAGGLWYDECPGITALLDNSTIATGYFYSETITFGQGEPNQITLENTSKEVDFFIARFNPDGTLAWAKNAGGTADDCSFAITALTDDTFVTTGFFYERATFGKGEPNQTVLYSPDGWIDIFIARYNPDGTLIWAKKAGGTGDDEGFAITSLHNSVVIAGYFASTSNGTAVFGQGEPNETTLYTAGYRDIFIAMYNSDGILQWAKSAGGSTDSDSALGITALSDNTTIVTGHFQGESIFGKSEPNQTTLTSTGYYDDAFIARYNYDGSLDWAKRIGGTSGDDHACAATTLDNNSIIVTGFFHESAIFGEGEPNEVTLASADEKDIFIARYNSSGSFIRVKSAGGDSWEKGLAIRALSDDTTIITGWFTNDCIFGKDEPNQTELTATRMSDIFIARFEP